MSLKKPLKFETAFGTYVANEKLGEGGAGVVYGGVSPDGRPIAIKVLSADRVSVDKRKRFKNEIGFLLRTTHSNIVAVIDHGVVSSEISSRPFYVMPRYDGSLRTIIGKCCSPEDTMKLFSAILDGVEAAHLYGAVHRDLKPENILLETGGLRPAIADFGVAQFTDDLLVTIVETNANQRLANFQYAAPEQRGRGMEVGIPADIYALGLILNELFTGTVPHGTQYSQIGQMVADYSFLDLIIATMICQKPEDRPQSIAVVKTLIQRHQAEAVSLQKLSKLNSTVIPEDTIDDPLAIEPPQLINAEWDNNQLTLTLDRPVTQPWIRALQNMGNFGSLVGAGPERFSFSGTKARVAVPEHGAQHVIDFFKQWLPRATQVLMSTLAREAHDHKQAQILQLNREREAEEKRLRINQSLKI